MNNFCFRHMYFQIQIPHGILSIYVIALSRMAIFPVFKLSFNFFNFLGWGETESTWYVGHYLAYCTSPGGEMMMSAKQSVE
jgi:hypothetical protein